MVAVPVWLARRLLGTLAVLGMLLVGCNDPQAPPAGDPDHRGEFDSGAGTLVFRLESPDGGTSPFRLVARDVQLILDAQFPRVQAQVSILNTSNESLPGPSAVLVSDFVPATVVPVNALCTRIPCPQGSECEILCVFRHEGTYGSDGLLGAGEISEPVEWVFQNPSGESFGFRARIEADPTTGEISGIAFRDRNGNGQHEATEPGIPGVRVSLQHNGRLVFTETSERGRFAFRVQEPGLYEVEFHATPNCIATTPARLEVVILQRPDGTLSRFSQANLGCRDSVRDIVVSGIVYVDHNRNGQHDPGELGIAGIGLVGSTPLCPTFAPIETRTDEHGRYVLHLPDCDPPWVVHRDLIRGLVDTSPNPVVFQSATTPNVALRADFGVAPLVDPPPPRPDTLLVMGAVFVDTNRNGVRESNELGVAGVEIVAAGGAFCQVPLFVTTVTDETGRYVLSGPGLPCPLPWEIRRAPIAGFIGTTPSSVVLERPPPDGSLFQVDFGVALADSPPG